MHELSSEQAEAILQARRDMFHAFQARWPDDAPALYASACVGGLLDVLFSPGMPPTLLALINAQLAGSPLQLGPRLAN
jgi:hypothetical protein